MIILRKSQLTLVALLVLGVFSAKATPIGTGQTVTDTSLAGQNVDFDGTLSNNGGSGSGNYDSGAALLSLSSDFTRSLGTGSNQVQWSGDGGFYYDPSNLGTHDSFNINIGGLSTPATLTWGQGGFVPNGNALVLDGNFNLENSINLGTDASATRQIDIQNVYTQGSTFAAISGSGNLLFQAYGANGTGQSHRMDLENSISIMGTLALSNVTADVGIYNQTAGFINVANLQLSNGAFYGDAATQGQTLRSGVNLTLASGATYFLAGSTTASGMQTVGRLNSTDSTTSVALGGVGISQGNATVSGAVLTVNSGYFAGQISDGVSGLAGTGFKITDPGVGGALIKTGAGILTLTGSNTYTAGTTVQQGTLLVANTTGSATGTGSVTVMSGGSLGGTGIIAPTGTNNVVVQSGGKIDLTAYDPNYVPASFTNTLTIHLASANSATFQTGSSFAFDLGAGGVSDELAFTGLTGGAKQVTFNDNAVSLNFLPGAGTGTYTLFSFDQSGAYSGALANGPDYAFQYYPDDITVTVTPEPSTWALLASGLAFVWFWRWKRVKANERMRY